MLWREGVSTVLWYLIVDSPPVPDYASTYQSGVYLLDGAPKPSATAFRFPFVVSPAGRSSALAWGKAPGQGVVTIELYVAAAAPRSAHGARRWPEPRRCLTSHGRVG